MAIDTTNEKLALMELGQVYEPGLPITPGVIDTGDQRQFLWDYPFDMTPEIMAFVQRDHSSDVFYPPDWRWLYPTSMSAPEFAPFIADVTVETEDCFSRRPEQEDQCLRRPVEDELALRRSPECPTEFACPNQGCV